MQKLSLRFSIRALFLLAILISAFCYGALLPWLNAQRFVTAVRDRERAAALAMLDYSPASGIHRLVIDRYCTMRIEPLSLRGMLKGEAMIRSEVPADWNWLEGASFRATRRGIETVKWSPEGSL
jgi:hypothetical protein